MPKRCVVPVNKFDCLEEQTPTEEDRRALAVSTLMELYGVHRREPPPKRTKFGTADLVPPASELDGLEEQTKEEDGREIAVSIFTIRETVRDLDW